MNLATHDPVLITGGPLAGTPAIFLYRLPSGLTVALDRACGAYAAGDTVVVSNGELLPLKPWRRWTGWQRLTCLRTLAEARGLAARDVTGRRQLVLAVCEDHRLAATPTEVADFLDRHLQELT